MSRRSLASISTLAIVIAVILAMTLPAASQAPSSAGQNSAAAKKWTMPRTPDGHPDLQGYWTNNGYVPLERPNNVTKEFYTPEEAEAAAQAAAAREAEQTKPGTTADVHYDFTQFGLDRSQTTLVKNLRTSLVYDPPTGRIPPLTAEAQKRQADRAAARKALGGQYDAVQNMPLGSRCFYMGGSGPPLLSAGYNPNYHIVQSKDHVMILTEMIHDVRIIPLDSRPHLPKDVQQWFGSSRGRWEGDTLVVESRNFSEKNPFRGFASPSMRLTERFTRVSDDMIKYTFTVEDETTWAQPWSAEAPLGKTIGPIFEFACHEANFGVTNILAGAREDEKRQAAEAAKKGQK